MRQQRAQPIDPKQAGPDGFVYGWYIHLEIADHHFIVPPCIEGEPDDWTDQSYLRTFVKVKKDTISQDTGETDRKRTGKFPKGQKMYEGDKVAAKI